jgi:HPt (histidine-containing phosphotransfer) domain-containing protein
MDAIAKTPANPYGAGRPEPRSAAWTVAALRSVWARQQDRIGERLDTIECALAALAGDGLDPELRRSAERAAHMLAGSVGMFGFLSAGQMARELEERLPHAARADAPELSALLLGVRRGLRGPASLALQPRHASRYARSSAERVIR